MGDGRVLRVNVSDGGVPKRPVDAARVTTAGVEGDRQNAVTVHGGPHRAVSILGIEAIRRIAAEGHPIGPGTTGENLTTEGFDASSLPVGTRLSIGEEVMLELSAPADPCRTIRHSFRDLRFGRLGMATHPADSRMYARVLREGTVRPGDPIRLDPPPDPAAGRHLLASRLDRAERSSSLSLWGAARDAGLPLHIVEDGELAMCAALALPGPIFNLAMGFANLPNLVGRALEHFRLHGTVGWVWADAPPWPGAVPGSTAVYAGGPAREADGTDRTPDGVTVRQLARDEHGAWADVIVRAAGLSGPVGDAWRVLEPRFALAPHDHRFVAEVDGRVVGTGVLHTHHRVGWLRAGTVLPEYRGHGIQGALIAARVRRARELGCELVGASANQGGSSARNVRRAGMEEVAVRHRYRVDGTERGA